VTDGRHVALPALDGLDPLGFLAALGVLRLLDYGGVDARLSFDPTLATARLTGVEDVDEVVGHLVALVEELPEGGLMVGLPPALVPPAASSAEFSDPGRISHERFAEFAAQATSADERAWIRALWTDLAVSEEKPKRCAFTPFYAPTGRQTLRTAFQKPAQLVTAEPDRLLRDALVAWRRVDGFTGENLDFRAVRGAADQPDGQATMSGVPGATWLALSAIPLFPMGGNGLEARTLRWHWLRFAAVGRRRLAFSWPIWRAPLDLDAVRALLAHRAVDSAAQCAADRSEGDLAVRRQLQALGVERVAVAHRRQLPGGKAAGVLVPAGSWS
jgi:CRISPR-associated endonuclease/helicase Cas3